MILCPWNRMSDTNDLTEQLPTMPGTDGCAPSVDDGNDVTALMHKVSVQEVASSFQVDLSEQDERSICLVLRRSFFLPAACRT